MSPMLQTGRSVGVLSAAFASWILVLSSISLLPAQAAHVVAGISHWTFSGTENAQSSLAAL